MTRKLTAMNISRKRNLYCKKLTVHEDFKQIADCLLGDVLLIPTIENGISLWKKNGFRGTFVTPEGDIISPHGVLTGGSGAAVEKSLLATKREIGELESEVAALAFRSGSENRSKKETCFRDCPVGRRTRLR